MQSSDSSWRRWLRPSRLIPLLTVLAAGTAIALSLIGLVQLNLAEGIIIALLALLAVDALTERLGLLERIEKAFERSSPGSALGRRADILTPVEHAKQASDIWIAVVTGASVIPPFIGFYESKLKEGCNIRVILLSPEVPALETWNLLAKPTYSQQTINTCLKWLDALTLLDAKGKCEVKLSQVYLPFSIFAVDPRKEAGSMIVEYHAYKVSIDEKPHVRLTAVDSPYWFGYYRQQFEKLWEDSIPRLSQPNQ